jgi:hypothetical protein
MKRNCFPQAAPPILPAMCLQRVVGNRRALALQRQRLAQPARASSRTVLSGTPMPSAHSPGAELPSYKAIVVPLPPNKVLSQLRRLVHQLKDMRCRKGGQTATKSDVNQRTGRVRRYVDKTGRQAREPPRPIHKVAFFFNVTRSCRP